MGTAKEPSPALAAAADQEGETPAQRLAMLRALADTDPHRAADQVWEWCKELAGEATRQRAGVDRTLQELFRAGTLPSELRGSTDGILITTTTNPAVDDAVRLLTKMWMPWAGKRFGATTGTNRMTKASRIPVKVLWPFYSMTNASSGGGYAFNFSAYADAGRLDPDVAVLAIDYTDKKNPRLLIRSIRDELVELVPGTYLGKILYRLQNGTFVKIGYFALHTP